MDYFLSLLLSLGMGMEAAAHAIAQPRPATITVAEGYLTPLNAAAIEQRLADLPGWETDGEALLHTRTFEDFVAAIAFINQLVEPAEALGHHPDITINYNRVSLELTTHDAGGITELDFQLAEKIAQL
ncbi:MAG: 4a-hydroxytetrahydrobiopterin dehydratase [Cyanobacteria bacterium J06638_28]